MPKETGILLLKFTVTDLYFEPGYETECGFKLKPLSTKKTTSTPTTTSAAGYDLLLFDSTDKTLVSYIPQVFCLTSFKRPDYGTIIFGTNDSSYSMNDDNYLALITYTYGKGTSVVNGSVKIDVYGVTF